MCCDGVLFLNRVLQFGRIAKCSHQCIKTHQCVSAEFRKRLTCTFKRLGRLIQTAFGEELVGIAYKFLLKALRQEVAGGDNGQVLGYNLSCGNARSSVTLTHAPMAVEPHTVKHPST